MLLVLSAGYFATSFVIPEPVGQYVVVGPRAFPLAIGVALMACTVWLGREDTATRHAPSPTDWRRLSRCALVFFVYIILVEPAGYLISTTAFIALEARILGSRSWLRNALAGGIVTFGVYGLLVLLLGLRLP